MIPRIKQLLVVRLHLCQIYVPINLSVPDLPHNIPILGSNVRIAYLDDCYGFISFNESSSLLSDLQCNSGNGFLFFLKGSCVAIIWTKKNIFLFDSHSRNSLGQPVPDGFSILLKFKNKKDSWYII